MAGFTYILKNHLFEAEVAYNLRCKHGFYLPENFQTELQTPPTYFNLSYRFMFNTTIGIEKSWESGSTKETNSHA